jgi:hypothetical protein
MKIYYDTEFLEDGQTIDLISIGMVAEDGREYYAVTYGERWLREIGEHDWLLANVAPSLPVKIDSLPTRGGAIWNHVTWNREHPDWPNAKSRQVIAGEVRDFIQATPDPQLWAWYGAYDHVVLSQLWGRMIDHPDGVPIWTNDLKQEAGRLGNPKVPEQAEGEHNALADARHNRVIADFLASLA